MLTRLYLLAVVMVLMLGCANVKIVRITPEDPYKEGIRFYRPYPYLLVTKDSEGKDLEGKIIYLPNMNEEYAISVSSGIGTVETKFTLEDGWRLTEFGETRDSKTVEMVNALTGSLKDLTSIFGVAKTKEEFLPGLYVFIFDNKTGFVTDLKPVIQFKGTR